MPRPDAIGGIISRKRQGATSNGKVARRALKVCLEGCFERLF